MAQPIVNEIQPIDSPLVNETAPKVDLQNLLKLLGNNPSILPQIENLIKEAQTKEQAMNQRTERQIKNEAKRKEKALPIYYKREEILNHVKENRFTIVVGDTGCGKSTQLPQYLFEEYETRPGAKILWVLPRKLPTLSLSERVCEEMEITWGQEIGYEVPNKQNYSEKTSLRFVTDAILINELISKRKKSMIRRIKLDYSIIVLDEVHERNLYTDILLASLKDICLESEMKLLVTSATINEKVFEDYFKVKAIHVEGRPYPVEIDYYPQDSNENLRQQISSFEHISHMANTISNVIQKMEDESYPYRGHILVFTSGVDDIYRLSTRLSEYEIDSEKFEILPLHGLLRHEEQKAIFRTCEGMIKIILSTRMAETALTIEGVRVVIDIGFDKESVYDAVKRMTIIENKFIPQSSAIQRAGRAGRTTNGLCIRLYSHEQFQKLSRNKVSEIQRMDLGKVALKLKAMGVPKISEFDFVEKPVEGTLQQTVEHLKELGALNKHNENLTRIGEAMLQLDTDPDFSKVILEGVERGCEHEVIDIIAMIGINSRLFSRGFDEETKELADIQKYEICQNTGDLMTLLNLYRTWLNQPSKDYQSSWCHSYYLRYSSFNDAKKTSKDLERGLHVAKRLLENQLDQGYQLYREEDYREERKFIKMNKEEQENKESLILKCFLKAFYQNVCLYTGISQLGYILLRDNMILKLHGASSLALLQEYPKYLFCLDINKANYNHTKVVSKIQQEWIEELFPGYKEKENFKFLNNQYKFHKLIAPRLGRQVLKTFLDYKQIELEDNPEYQGISFFADFKEGELIAYTYSQDFDQVKQKMRSALKETIQTLEQETREISMTNHTRGIFQAGGEVREILLNNESISVKFDAFDPSWDGAKIYKAFSKAGKIAQIGLIEFDRETQLKHGVVRMNSRNDVEKIMEFYRQKGLGEFKSEKSLINPSLELMETSLKGISKRALRVKIEWYAGKSDGAAHLVFKTSENANMFIQRVFSLKPKLKGSDVLYEPALPFYDIEDTSQMVLLKLTKNPKNLLLKNLKIDIDEVDIENMIRDYKLDNGGHVHIKVFRSPYQGELIIAPEDIPSEIYTELIKQQIFTKLMISEEDILRINVYKPYEQTKVQVKGIAVNLGKADYKRSVEVDVFDYTTARKIIDYFDENINFDILTLGRLHCKLNFTRRRKIKWFQYRIIQKELKETISDLIDKMKNSVIFHEPREQNENQNGKVPRDVSLRIIANDPLRLDECCKAIDPIVNGVPFYLKTVAQMKKARSEQMKQNYEQIEARHGVYINLRFKNKFLQVLGEKESRRLALEELENIFNTVEQVGWTEAKVNFKHRPVQHLLKNNAAKLAEIESKYIEEIKNEDDTRVQRKTLQIRYSLIHKEIIIKGKPGTVAEAVKEIRDLVYQKEEKEDLADNECPLCLSEVIDGYRLQLCGHNFCSTCIETELDERLNNSSDFPFYCSQCKSQAEGKPELKVMKICVKDLTNLLRASRVKVLWEKSLECYLLKNSALYFQCFSPDCPQIFRHNGQREFTCDYCLKSFCKDCQENAHGDSQCEKDARAELIKSLEEAGKDFRECPGCKMIIEKVAGCFKMHCQKCHTIFCWLCREMFYTDSETYKHLTQVHQKIGDIDPQNDDLDFD